MEKFKLVSLQIWSVPMIYGYLHLENRKISYRPDLDPFGVLTLFGAQKLQSLNFGTCCSFDLKFGRIFFLKDIKAGPKALQSLRNNWNTFVNFRRRPGHHICQVNRRSWNSHVFLAKLTVLRKSGGKEGNVFLKEVVFCDGGYHERLLKRIF